MVRLRLRRVGLKGQPSYRIVATDQRSPRDGRFIEIIGQHNPRTEPGYDAVDEERAWHWLALGAQPSDAVRRILQRTGTIERFARLQAGEDREALLAEVLSKKADREVSQRTQFPAPGLGQSKKKAREQSSAAAEAS